MQNRHVRLFWSSICILHNREKQFLAKVVQRLAEQGIDLELSCFGLGYATHLAQGVWDAPDGALPDIVVSTDLEVFEDPRIAARLDRRYPCAEWQPLKDIPATRAVMRDRTLLPIVAIPLVLFGRGWHEGSTLPQIARACTLAFGGINNSAAKTLVKAVWQLYGRAAAEELLTMSQVHDMPVGAFQAVRSGQADVACVPSVYAMRASGDLVEAVPEEGTLLLPAYCCARQTIDEQTARTVVEALVDAELLDFYDVSGDLVTCIERAGAAGSRHEHDEKVCAVSQEFLERLDPQDFFDLYCAHLPTAVQTVA